MSGDLRLGRLSLSDKIETDANVKEDYDDRSNASAKSSVSGIPSTKTVRQNEITNFESQEQCQMSKEHDQSLNNTSPFKGFSANIVDKKERNSTLFDGRTVTYYSLTVEIVKKPGQTLGLYLREGDGDDRTNGVFVSRIAERSELEKSPWVLLGGDEILVVNQVDVTEMCLDDVVVLMSIPKKLILKTVRKEVKENLSKSIVSVNAARSPAKSIIKPKKSDAKKTADQLPFDSDRHSDVGKLAGRISNPSLLPPSVDSPRKRATTPQRNRQWRISAPVVIEQENFHVQEYYPRGVNCANSKSYFNAVLMKSNSLPRHRSGGVAKSRTEPLSASTASSSLKKMENWKKSSCESVLIKEPGVANYHLYDYFGQKSPVNNTVSGSAPELPVIESVNPEYLLSNPVDCYSTLVPVVNYVFRQPPNSAFYSNYYEGAGSAPLHRGRCPSCGPPFATSTNCCCAACPMHSSVMHSRCAGHRGGATVIQQQPWTSSLVYESSAKQRTTHEESRKNRSKSPIKSSHPLLSQQQQQQQQRYVSPSVTGVLIFHIIEGRGLYANLNTAGASVNNDDADADEEMYCVIQVDGEHRARTEVSNRRACFRWNEIFEIDVWEAKQADFFVYSWHPMHRRTLRHRGRLRLQEALLTGRLHNQEQCFALCLDPTGQLLIRVGYQSVLFAYRRHASKRRDAYWGVPLSMLIFRESQGNNDSPILLKRMLGEVELRGADSPGLYSMCVSMEKKLMVRHQLETQPTSASLNFDAVPDPNLITTLIKDFFRELPEPLVPSATYQMLVDTWRVLLPNNKEGNAKLIFGILEYLPDDHKRTFVLLMDHLKYLTSRSPQNGLTLEKLSKIFGPLLFCTCRPNDCQTKRVPINYLDHRLAAFVFEVLMDLWPYRNINSEHINVNDVGWSTGLKIWSPNHGADEESYC